MRVLFFSLIVIMIGTSEKCEPTANSELYTSFYNEDWLLSREEGMEQDAEIYRPRSYQKWPPSRFRNVYKFNSDGTGKYFKLAPNDAHKMVDCHWKIENETSNLIIRDGQSFRMVYKIISLESDKLLLKRINL